MERKRRFSSREKGTALLLSLMTGVFTLGLVLPFLFKLTGQYRITEKSYKSLAALNLAEAGLERAIWELNFGNISSWRGLELMAERTFIISAISGRMPHITAALLLTRIRCFTAMP